jgi:hypothetical protein
MLSTHSPGPGGASPELYQAAGDTDTARHWPQVQRRRCLASSCFPSSLLPISRDSHNSTKLGDLGNPTLGPAPEIQSRAGAGQGGDLRSAKADTLANILKSHAEVPASAKDHIRPAFPHSHKHPGDRGCPSQMGHSLLHSSVSTRPAGCVNDTCRY